MNLSFCIIVATVIFFKAMEQCKYNPLEKLMTVLAFKRTKQFDKKCGRKRETHTARHKNLNHSFYV